MLSVVDCVGKSGIGVIVITALCGSISALIGPEKIGDFCVDGSSGVCSSELSVWSQELLGFGESVVGGWYVIGGLFG